MERNLFIIKSIGFLNKLKFECCGRPVFGNNTPRHTCIIIPEYMVQNFYIENKTLQNRLDLHALYVINYKVVLFFPAYYMWDLQ